ncbi:uncharacterized protein RHOBADRAFT_49612 [Rhodotorula graminis WP1]|uniref:Cyclin-like domain-containing protein n=1 Tax=Rhodotorula graminis (strain WP1) TaxID=578459 RepID=A0A194S6C2_RHOGW|nr:uncharacterized protein RHOBADRAFT_49612 [Rhodotorula graminis WP1]KPV76094.1 hypothetical protein RHOBADRAFT_49612 [Rhodotorula graminis WP1]
MASLEGVPPPAPPPAADAPPPLAVTRDFRPYYSPVELDYLVHLQAHARHSTHAPHPHHPTTLSDHRIEHYRQLACGFIERVAARLGFPRRTIATAQKLYHRFHLHFSLTDFAYQDVSLATLLVASKLEDTLKKLREIQIAAYQVSNLLEGGNGMGEGDPNAQEAHRPHLIGIERLVLQTISFNFNLHRSLDPVDADAPSGTDAAGSDDALLLAAALATPPPTRDAFTYLVRLAQSLPSLPPALFTLPSTAPPGTAPPTPDAVLKQLTFASFLLLTDLHRTLAPLSYPPHTCAAACVYLAGFMLVAASTARRGSGGVGGATAASGEEGTGVWDAEVVSGWATSCESDERDIDDIAQMLLDLLIYLCPSSSSTSTSAFAAASTVSPLFSPSSASPSEAGPAPLSDRDKHLVATGVPNAFAAHPLLGARASVDALTRVKIDLRRAREAHGSSSSSSSGARGTKRKRPSSGPEPLNGDASDEPPVAAADDDDEPDTPLTRARRWTNLEAGLVDVGRVRDERALRELVRAEDRAERERAAAGGAAAGLEAGAGAVGGGGGAAGDGRTEEERERDRRDRRERLRPGSVRYRF